MNSPDVRDSIECDEIAARTGVRPPPLWARELMASYQEDRLGAAASVFAEPRAGLAMAALFRIHVISKYVELVAREASPGDIDDPLFSVMVRLTYTRNDRRHPGGAGGAATAWAVLWSALREAPSQDIEDPADYFCAWFHARQDDWYPEPPFERFAPFDYEDASGVVERFPGLDEAIKDIEAGSLGYEAGSLEHPA